MSCESVPLELVRALTTELRELRMELSQLRSERGRSPSVAGRLLSRTDLRGFGLERRAVDAVFLALPVVHLPGYARPLIREADYLELLEARTFSGDRVIPK